MCDNNGISGILQNSLFLIGAGFSKDAGCLTSVEMLEDLKKKIFEENSKIFLPAQKEALKFLISCLKYHSEWRTMETENGLIFDPNIEELALLIRRVRNRENFLPYPITGNWADKLVQLESDYSTESKENGTLFDSLELKLKKLLKDEWLNTSDNTNLEYLKPLVDFLKAYPNEQFRIDMFSLNYDTVIEQFFEKEDEIPWRGFSNGQWQDIAPDEENDPNTRINLYKLHGSVDWVRLTDMDTWETPKPKLEDAGTEDDEKIDLLDNIDEKHNPYIVFGQGTKSFSVEPFFSILHHFNKSLQSNEKKYFFVIGYSFFDPYINNLLFNAVKGFKKLIIVNPSFAPDAFFKKYGKNGRLESDRNNYFRAIYENGFNEGNLTDFIREIQKNKFYSELPEFNYISLSAENIEYIPLTTREFLDKFFLNKGSLLREYINNFEKKLIDKEPF